MTGIVNVLRALEIRLAAMPGVLPTAHANMIYDPPKDVAYQRATLLPADTVNPVMGAAMYREVGTFHILLLYPLNGGLGAAYSMAEAIRAWFPRGSSFTNDGVTVRVEGTPVIRPGMRDEDRYTVPVLVRYFANIIQE